MKELIDTIRNSAPRDAALIVHSAFSNLSRQGYAAREIIEGLRETVADGALYMPTMTWRTVTEQSPVWDEMKTPSHTGFLTEVFRTEWATARSIHPTHSVAGVGRRAEAILSSHHIDATPVSANSPYGILRDYDTHILMLGVGLECCTAIHHAEEVIAESLYVKPEVFDYRCIDRHGVEHIVPTRRHMKLNRDFPKFAARLGRLRSGMIGDCPWTLVPMRDLLAEVFASLIDDPRATLADSVRECHNNAAVLASAARVPTAYGGAAATPAASA